MRSSADPTMQQAEALHMASRETRTQAILNMLPLNANASKNWSGVASQRQSTPALGNLNLQVNLFSWDSWVALKQASSTVAQGEADYQAAPRRPDRPGRAGVFRRTRRAGHAGRTGERAALGNAPARTGGTAL